MSHHQDDAAAAVALTTALVGVDSVNPSLVPGAAGERAAAALVADRLDAAGYDTALVEPPGAPGRTSVLAVREFGPGRTVVLNGHLDTVGVEGMDEPFTARIDGERMTGRGTCDMKAGVAGMVVAAERLAHEPPPAGRVVVALVADEEDASVGTETVLAELAARGLRADVALVGEPTWLDLAVAHRGYALVRARLRGRAAHTSQPTQGVDAVAALGRLLVAVTEADRRLQETVAHPYVGHGTTLVSVARGGSAPFTVAAQAEAIVERRTLPGESGELALAEVADLVAAVREGTGIDADVSMVLAREAWEADATGPAAELMAALRVALPAAGARAPRDTGAPYWMESALFQQAGVPAVVCGPAGGALHAVDEWVDLAQVRAYPLAVTEAVRAFLTGPGSR